MNNEKLLISKDLIIELIQEGEIHISEDKWAELREALDSKTHLCEMYYIGDVDGYGCLYSEAQEDSLVVYRKVKVQEQDSVDIWYNAKPQKGEPFGWRYDDSGVWKPLYFHLPNVISDPGPCAALSRKYAQGWNDCVFETLDLNGVKANE